MESRKPVQTGYLNRSGHPAIKIGIHGIHPDLQREFEALIDTGFTGFLLMPIMSAFPLGLTLVGTSSYTLADGSTSPKLLALGTITLGGERTTGVIVLESNQCDLLLGMDFLRQSKRALAVSIQGVALVDEEIVTKFLTQDVPSATNNPSTKISEPPDNG